MDEYFLYMFCFCMLVTLRLEICSKAGYGLDDPQRDPSQPQHLFV